jgi:hypothetical protein
MSSVVMLIVIMLIVADTEKMTQYQKITTRNQNVLPSKHHTWYRIHNNPFSS